VILFEHRACAILFNLLRTRRDPRPWLLPANICNSVPETFAAAAQPFVLVDIEEPSLEIDVSACVAKIEESSCAGVLLARVYGSDGDRTPVFERLKHAQPDLFVIDDKCLCPPDVDGEQLSALADMTLFSTGRAKYVDLGEGGFAHVASISYDRHLPAPEATWEEHRQRIITARDDANRHKQALNAIYENALPAEIQMPAALQQWRFNILVRDSEALVASIFEAGLFASRHYAPLGNGFPVARRLQERVVNLFNDRYFDEERARRLVEVILRHLAAHD
jgi:hypothetical protein